MSLRFRLLVTFIAIDITPRVAPAANVLTQHVDNQRTGAVLDETALNHASVRMRFHRLWTLFADAKIMAQPLYVSGLKSSACPSGCNVVIFATMKGTVYAYKADQRPKTQNDTLVWARYLGDPRPGGNDIDMWAVDDPWWGVLGTPAIDVVAGLMYVVVWNPDQQYRLYALDLLTGNVKMGPVVLQGSVAGTSFAGAHSGFVQTRKQRAGVLLDHGSVYVAFGGDNPGGIAGWLFVYDAATLAPKAVWSPTPGGRNGGIWMGGQGPAADGDGFVYLAVGDGEFDPAHQRFGSSVVKLELTSDGSGTSRLTVRDSFTPCEQALLDKCDLDLGSAGPLLLPHGQLVMGGKSGNLYLLSTSALGGFKPGFTLPSHACEVKRPLTLCSDSAAVEKIAGAKGHIHGGPVYWKGSDGQQRVYVMGEGDHLNAYTLVGSRLDGAHKLSGRWKPPAPDPHAANCSHTPDSWMAGGMLAVSSNGDKAGTGVVWVLTPANGDANSFRGVKGMLMALDAENVRKELWRSQKADLSDGPDSYGLLSRFTPPTVANGKVFVATGGDREELHQYCGTNRPTPDKYAKNYRLVVFGLTP